jgi:4'-phosphopantetheinyl transferase EntD
VQMLAVEAYLFLAASFSAAAALQKQGTAISPVDGNHGAPLPPATGT